MRLLDEIDDNHLLTWVQLAQDVKLVNLAVFVPGDRAIVIVGPEGIVMIQQHGTGSYRELHGQQAREFLQTMLERLVADTEVNES